MLGLVITPYGTVPGAYPWEINRTITGTGSFLKPHDPWYYQRGETGFYYDTYLGGARGLGAIPTDAEMGPNMCYTPVGSDWIETTNAYVPPPWVPPNGWSPAGAYGPVTSYKTQPTGLAGALRGVLSDVESELVEHHRKMFTLSALSTAAAVASSLLIFYRTAKLIADDTKARNKAGI
jgi:hypothetical protein